MKDILCPKCQNTCVYRVPLASTQLTNANDLLVQNYPKGSLPRFIYRHIHWCERCDYFFKPITKISRSNVRSLK